MKKPHHYKKIYNRAKSWWKYLGWFLRGLFFSFLFFVGVSSLVFIYYAKDLPRPERFTELYLIQPTKIYDRTGEVLLYEIFGEEKREIISLKELPQYLLNAIIAIEDANFYRHFGLEPKGIVRAILVNLKLRKPVQGGSTITQQLVRTSFLTRKKTIERKIQELVLTLELERRYSKDQILEFYINQIPLGSNAYGISAASKIYFGKKPSELSLAESAALAAMIKAPSYYSPYGTHLKELLLRKNYILERMENLGFISKEERIFAQAQEIKFADPGTTILAPHFVLWVQDQLLETYGENFLRENGLKVITTLDWELQKTAEEIIARFDSYIRSFNANNAALVALDPKTGEVLAMVGSKNWFGEPYPAGCTPGINCLFDPKVNVATKIPGRQPGSAFKPFAYVTAFAKGHRDDEIVVDEPTNFGVWGGKEYIPQNYDGKFRGPVTLRQSLAQSLNIPSIKVLLTLAGIKDSINTAREFGLSTIKEDPSYYGPALVLGGGEVRLLDLVSAYGVFATKGLRLPTLTILRIEDAKGNILQENKNTPARVFPKNPIELLTDILSDNEARAPIFGANSVLYFPGKKIAVKTGTTQDFRDGWVIGYTDNIVVGVWVGNNDNSPMQKEPGIVVAGPIWRAFMEKVLNR